MLARVTRRLTPLRRELVKGMHVPVTGYDLHNKLVSVDMTQLTWQDVSVIARFPALFHMPRGGGMTKAELELGAWLTLLERVPKPLKGMDVKILWKEEEVSE